MVVETVTWTSSGLIVVLFRFVRALAVQTACKRGSGCRGALPRHRPAGSCAEHHEDGRGSKRTQDRRQDVASPAWGWPQLAAQSGHVELPKDQWRHISRNLPGTTLQFGGEAFTNWFRSMRRRFTFPSHLF